MAERDIQINQQERYLQEVNKQRYLQKLGEIQMWLIENNIPFRILGGLALAAYVDPTLENVSFNRKGIFIQEQRVPDVDLLVQRTDVVKTFEYGQQLRHDPNFPIKLEVTPAVRHRDLHEGEETSVLFHKQLHIPIPTEVFKPIIRYIDGTPIVTVDPLTLFHTFSVIGGILRTKDWRKILPLGRYIRDDQISEFSEDSFVGFHEFLKSRVRSYPLYVPLRRIGLKVAAMTPRPVENFLRYLYKIVDERGGKAS